MFRLLLALVLCLAWGTPGAAGGTELSRFEARHLHAIELTPDRTRLLVVHAPTATLSVFALPSETRELPVLQKEIPVGLEPVTVRARTQDEAWVVNELSDSISIVDLVRGVVVETLSADDEPADVVFAAGLAYVSCARNNLVRVFDAVTRQPRATIPLAGVFPRALVATQDGSKVYAAFFHSGNRTTALPVDLAPPPLPPAQADLPLAPPTSLLVSTSDPRLPFKVLDHDVAEIDTATGTVTRYLGGVGTNLSDLSLSSDGHALWVANTEALNLTPTEPALRGHFVDSRLTRIDLTKGQSQPLDLNAGLNYAVLPNLAAQASALAQPSALVRSTDGQNFWVAAEGSDQVAEIAPDGSVRQRIDLRRDVAPGSIGTGAMRGPRSLVLEAAREQLFVFNKLSDTVSILDTKQGDWLGEFAAGSRDPTPEPIRLGRKLFSDARLAGNGTAACTACHPDGDQDGIAWDLGDPTADIVMSAGHNVGRTKLLPRVLHPLKGPMVTQTLRGLAGTGDLHWRGDRKDIQSFNVSFDKLQGGSRLPPEQMDLIAQYLLSLRHYPNPFRTLDDTPPAVLRGGNPLHGRALFTTAKGNCTECHQLPLTSDNNIDAHKEVGGKQPVKTPTLRTVYQRVFYDGRPGQESLSGYGLAHDGTGYELPIAHPYVLDSLATPEEFRDVTAFVLSVDTGTPPAVGRSVTMSLAKRADPERLRTIEMLERQAHGGAIELIVRGLSQGRPGGWRFDPIGGTYRSCDGGSAMRAELISLLGEGDAVTFLGILPGQGSDYLGEPGLVARPSALR